MLIHYNKGFNKDLTCRGFPFEIGKTYEHYGEVSVCNSGFHSCEYPLDCFEYYPPGESIYAKCIVDGEIKPDRSDDSKIASSKISIVETISIHQLAIDAMQQIMDGVDKQSEKVETEAFSIASNIDFLSTDSNTGFRSAVTNTGDFSTASNTGFCSAAINTGTRSIANNEGNYSIASNTGHHSIAGNTGGKSAASNTGKCSAAITLGVRSTAEVSGLGSVAAGFGFGCKARANEGGAIVLVYLDDDGEIIHIRASKVGENGIKPNVWYKLDEQGNFVECEGAQT